MLGSKNRVILGPHFRGRIPVRQGEDMGFAIQYKTTELISPALQTEMIDAANTLSKGRTWLSCEPPCLFDNIGKLVGFSKPNFLPHPEDVASARAEGLPDGTINDVLDVLCALSRQFDIEWEVSHDYADGPIGYIRNGICDDEVRTQCDTFNDLADELRGDDFDFDDR
jgi:hypothetical protein